ncbi:MAG: hypothetical protein LC659_16280 [Myxococcales bacterium]|nr:hypothetical protein [Myxococcales bacterium]
MLDARGEAPVVAERELRFLVSLAQPARRGEAVGVEAVDDVRLIAHAAPLAEDAGAGLAPRRGDDERVGLRAVDAIEGRRLVIDVDDPHRDDDDARAEVDRLPGEVVEERLLDLELALVGGGRDRMLDLELAVEAQLLREVVADVEDEAAHVDDVRPVRRRVERQLAVAADRGRAADAGLLERDLDLGFALQLKERRTRDGGLRLVGGESDAGLRVCRRWSGHEGDRQDAAERTENENQIQFHVF